MIQDAGKGTVRVSHLQHAEYQVQRRHCSTGDSSSINSSHLWRLDRPRCVDRLKFLFPDLHFIMVLMTLPMLTHRRSGADRRQMPLRLRVVPRLNVLELGRLGASTAIRTMATCLPPRSLDCSTIPHSQRLGAVVHIAAHGGGPSGSPV